MQILNYWKCDLSIGIVLKFFQDKTNPQNIDWATRVIYFIQTDEQYSNLSLC